MKKYKSKLKTLSNRYSLLLGRVGVGLFILSAVTIGVCSCKAWRTITTTATYVQQNDSTKASATITTKTVEEYQGVKKK